MRKWVLIALSLAMMVLSVGFTSLPEESPFAIASNSAILLDAGAGQVIVSYHADTPVQIAGVTKVMTALLIFEAIEEGKLTLEESVQISDVAASMGGTQAFLQRGKSYQASELIKAMCIASANDAAVALAEKVSGSQDVFVARMNERARELGATNTNFTNCTGIEDEAAYSTAQDLARIASALLEHRQVLKYTSIYMDTITHPDGSVTELVNANRMVRFYANCDGLFTGSSTLAKYCGIVTAQRGEQRLVAIVLGAQNSNTRFSDAQNLLEYGFANYATRVAVKKGEIVQKNVEVAGGSPRTVNLEAAEEARIVIEKGTEADIRKELMLYDEQLVPPLEQGQVVGELYVYYKEELVATIPAVTSATVKELSIWESIRAIMRRWILG